MQELCYPPDDLSDPDRGDGPVHGLWPVETTVNFSLKSTKVAKLTAKVKCKVLLFTKTSPLATNLHH